MLNSGGQVGAVQPLISVVLPVFNVRRDWVREAVDSILAIEVPVELVVVDDGSTDQGLVDDISGLPAADRRVRYVRQDNAGVAAARNRGVGLATGRWVTFVDPDDRIRPRAHALTGLPELADVDLVITGGLGFPADGRPVSETYSLAAFGPEASAKDLLLDMLGLYRVGRESSSFVIGVPWSKLVRREFLTENRLMFDESIVKRSDAEWVIRVLDRSPKVVVIDDPLIEYRLDIPGSISNRYRPEILRSYQRIMRTAAECDGVPSLRLQIYALELVKDAINNVFSSPAAPRSAVSRGAYREFRDGFTVTRSLLTSGALAGVSVPRKLLYLAIWRKWYGPIVGLRWVKRMRRATGA